MKRGILVLVVLFIVPFVSSQAMSFEDMFESRTLSYSSDKVMVPIDGVFNARDQVSMPYYIPGDESIFYYAEDNLIATTSDGNVKYYYLDRIGDDMASKSLPFGQPITIGNVFSFTGKEFDEDLYYFGARYYDPNLGKFTSVDPVKDNHAYVYVSNDPMNLVDPDGREEAVGSWSPPTYGTPVDVYTLQLTFGGGPWSFAGTTPDTSMVFNIPDPLLSTGVTLRVAGIDAQGRQGPWSDPSNTYYGSGISGITLEEGRNMGPLPTPYPNPAGSGYTNVRYYVPEGGGSNFDLGIYDISGKLVKKINVDPGSAGFREEKWDLRDRNGQDVASGVYILRYSFDFKYVVDIETEEGEFISKIQVANPIYTTKMTVVK